MHSDESSEMVVVEDCQGSAVEMSTPSSPSIAISYRRRDAAAYARTIRDAIRDRIGSESVFMDLQIRPGDDFGERISQAVGSCEILLAVIGDRWLEEDEPGDRRKIDEPSDWLRLEIETALDRNVRVIPVLVGGARMPEARQLPVSLARFARREAVELSEDRWEYDLDHLLAIIEDALPERARAARKADWSDGARPVVVVDHRKARRVFTPKLTAVHFDPEGRRLLTSSIDGSVRIWELPTGREMTSITHLMSIAGGYAISNLLRVLPTIYDAAFAPDGDTIATASGDGTVRIWDPVSGRQLRKFQWPKDWEPERVAFRPDGRRIAVALRKSNRYTAVDVFDPQEVEDSFPEPGRLPLGSHGVSLLHGEVSHAFVKQVHFSPDGSRLVTASERDGTARVWDLDTATEVIRIAHGTAVLAAEFSADGQRLATGGGDETARVWDAASGAELRRLAHHGSVTGVAFGPDGHLLATAGEIARVWDSDSGAEIAKIAHDPWVYTVEFSPTGRQLATAGGRYARIWEANLK